MSLLALKEYISNMEESIDKTNLLNIINNEEKEMEKFEAEFDDEYKIYEEQKKKQDSKIFMIGFTKGIKEEKCRQQKINKTILSLSNGFNKEIKSLKEHSRKVINIYKSHINLQEKRINKRIDQAINRQKMTRQKIFNQMRITDTKKG